jgi:hypothetical protein
MACSQWTGIIVFNCYQGGLLVLLLRCFCKIMRTATSRQALHRIFITIRMRHAGRIKARQAERARGEGL